MIRFNSGLPVEKVLPELETALQNSTAAVLCAAPGAGKSTLVPPALLDASFLHGQKILMLEPRRIAAVGVAKRIAYLLNEPVGGTVGYRTRFGSAVSGKTRIEVITEGILTRMIQDDPELSGVGMILFDEYHERSLQADLGLALALDIRSALRDDLRIVIMSATLDSQRIANMLGKNTPIITSGGKVYPVETQYMPPEKDHPLEKSAASAVLYALNHHEGDLLVFLPGEGEIRRCMQEMERFFPDPGAQKLVFLPLYGNLPESEQRRALEPDPAMNRKVIFSTPVAESSVTVPGVRIVIDSGWMRVPRFSAATAMNKLETVRVSLASADQRRGRAARTGPGLCIRLWNQSEEHGFAPYNTPEILAADLASTALELAKWGISPDTVQTLQWLDPPPRVRLEQAFSLLRSLQAVEADSCRLTPHGEKLLTRPMHPRLAHMISFAEKLGMQPLACAIASVLSERDFLRGTDYSDLNERLLYLCPNEKNSGNIERNTLQRIRTAYKSLTHGSFSQKDLAMSGVLTASAYPDRIARTKTPNSGEYILSNGVTAHMHPNDDMRKYLFLSLPVVEGTGVVPFIFLSAELTLADIEKYFSDQICSMVTAQWNNENKNLSVHKEKRIGSVVLISKQLPASTSELPATERLKVFLNGIRDLPLPWSEHESSLLNRLNFLHKTLGDDWPDVSPENLNNTLEAWLAPFLTDHHNSLESLRGQTLADALKNLVGLDRLRKIEKYAPERIEVPSGSHIRVDYTQDPPRLPVRLQEVFGMVSTPMLANGHVPLVMELLSPAMRPVQITSDLANFWKESYFLVRKDMRGRYPKHDWPENPLEVPAHRGVKRKR